MNGKPMEESSAHTMPLLGGVVRPQEMPQLDEESSVDSIGSRGVLGRSSLLLLVFTVACASLWLMRRSQIEVPASEGAQQIEQKIEEALARLASADTPLADAGAAGSADIVAIFAGNGADQQVPVQYLKKNPFVVGMPPVPVGEAAKPAAAKTGKDQPAAASGAPRPTRTDELRKELESLRLQAVMQGNLPMTIINGQIIKPGQQIGSFRLVKILEREVRMECDGQTFRLRMEP